MYDERLALDGKQCEPGGAGGPSALRTPRRRARRCRCKRPGRSAPSSPPRSSSPGPGSGRPRRAVTATWPARRGSTHRCQQPRRLSPSSDRPQSRSGAFGTLLEQRGAASTSSCRARRASALVSGSLSPALVSGSLSLPHWAAALSARSLSLSRIGIANFPRFLSHASARWFGGCVWAAREVRAVGCVPSSSRVKRAGPMVALASERADGRTGE